MRGEVFIPCPFCDYDIPIKIREGDVRPHEVEVIVETRSVEVHIRYCAKNPEATPI